MSEKEKKQDKIAEEIRREHKELNRRRIEKVRELEPKLEAAVVGVWGHMTTIGGREYAVYKENDKEHYFVVMGKSENVVNIASDDERKRAIQELGTDIEDKIFIWGEERKEIGGYVIKSIDPENTPNQRPVRSIEEFLNE